MIIVDEDGVMLYMYIEQTMIEENSQICRDITMALKNNDSFVKAKFYNDKWYWDIGEITENNILSLKTDLGTEYRNVFYKILLYVISKAENKDIDTNILIKYLPIQSLSGYITNKITNISSYPYKFSEINVIEADIEEIVKVNDDIKIKLTSYPKENENYYVYYKGNKYIGNFIENKVLVSIQNINIVNGKIMPIVDNIVKYPNQQTELEKYKNHERDKWEEYVGGGRCQKRRINEKNRMIGLISTDKSYGADDFKFILKNCKIKIKESIIPKYSIENIRKAIKELNDDECGAICIIRGGGTSRELKIFNDFNLCKAIRETNKPVITGIGHNKDVLLCSEAADYDFITPTEAALAIREVLKESDGFFTRIRRLFFS